jgi:hypothetical protein
MNNNESSSTGIIVGVLVVVVIAVVAWVAYTQGLFNAKQQKPQDNGSLQINVGGSSNTPNTSNTPAAH